MAIPITTIEKECADLKEYVVELSMKYFSMASSRQNFLNEINQLIDHLLYEVRSNCLSAAGALDILSNERRFLEEQQFRLVIRILFVAGKPWVNLLCLWKHMLMVQHWPVCIFRINKAEINNV